MLRLLRGDPCKWGGSKHYANGKDKSKTVIKTIFLNFGEFSMHLNVRLTEILFFSSCTTIPWQLPQDLFTIPTSSMCCNQHYYLHKDPWQLPQDLVTTKTCARCCNQPCYLHNDPWQFPQDLIVTPTYFKCCYQPVTCTTTPGSFHKTWSSLHLTPGVVTSLLGKPSNKKKTISYGILP